MNAESLSQTLRDQFELGPRADEFAQAVLSHLKFGEGGLSGFMKRVEAAGFATDLRQWLSGEDLAPMSSALTANLLGTGFLSKLSTSFGQSVERVADAAGATVPALIYLNGQPAQLTEVKPENALRTKDRPNWAWGVLGLAVVGAVCYAAVSCGQQNLLSVSTDKAPAAVTNSSSSDLMPKQPGFFMVKPDGTAFRYEGMVAKGLVEPMTRDLEAALGETEISGGLAAMDVQPFAWASLLRPLLDLLRGQNGQVSLQANGDTLKFVGQVADKALFEQELNKVLGDRKVDVDTSELVGPRDSAEYAPAPESQTEAAPAATPRSAERAEAALQNLGDSFTKEQLVAALNECPINFATGSARIDAPSLALLRKAAEAIKKAPGSVRIEVGGHTDNVGQTGTNMALSMARAQAVVRALKDLGVSADKLTFAGYGSSMPIAANDTPAGRAQNRRMQFKLLN